jgi:hypothetical protein
MASKNEHVEDVENIQPLVEETSELLDNVTKEVDAVVTDPVVEDAPETTPQTVVSTEMPPSRG